MIVIVFQGCKCIFRRVNKLGYSEQLFLIMPVNYDVSNVPPFYQSLMNTWLRFSFQKGTQLSLLDCIPFEQFWYNSYVTHNSNIITATDIQQFIALRIKQVK